MTYLCTHRIARIIGISTLLLLTLAHHDPASAQDTTITYQGQLRQSAAPFTGTADLQFRLFNQAIGGSQIGATQTRNDWPIEDGLFQVELDFGLAAFTDQVRYLEVRVDGNPLSPRQAIRPAPMALFALGGNEGPPGPQGPEGSSPFTLDAATGAIEYEFDDQVFRFEPINTFNVSVRSPSITLGHESNSASARGAVVSGGGTSGQPNSASGDFSTIGGGEGNTASAQLSTISGGENNTASGIGGTVSGGAANRAIGTASTVGGGLSNTASGRDSTVSGGTQNCAGGSNSWAGGIGAKVRPTSASSESGDGCLDVAVSGDADGDEGTFIWADNQFADFVSTGPNQFLVRAQGGVGFNTNTIPPNIDAVFRSGGGPNTNVDLYLRTEAHGRGINLAMLPTAGAAEFRIAQYDGSTFTDRLFLRANGDFQVTANAFKPGGGSWANSSDARLKKEIEPLHGALPRLLRLEGVTFEYSDPDPAVRPAGEHIGFVAQQVAEVFPDWVGEDAAGFLTVGSKGFEALTVEALRELRAEKDMAVALLQEENMGLRKQLAGVESRNIELGASLAELRQQQDEELASMRAELALLREMLAPQAAKTSDQR